MGEKSKHIWMCNLKEEIGDRIQTDPPRQFYRKIQHPWSWTGRHWKDRGNKEPNKFAKAGFLATRSEFMDAFLIDELTMTRVFKLISYDPEACRLMGEIVNVSVDESILGENGKVGLQKLQPITYAPMNHHYLVLDE